MSVNSFLLFSSGYDFAYLLKVLTAQNLPSEESEFFDLLKLYFPNIYDVKYLMKSCKSLKGGLQEVAELLEVRIQINKSFDESTSRQTPIRNYYLINYGVNREANTKNKSKRSKVNVDLLLTNFLC